MKKVFYAIITLCCFTMTGCSGNISDSNTEESLNAFTNSFINYDIKGCMQYVTEDSKPTLRFIASNITQKDVDKLRSMLDGASFEVIEVSDVDDTHSIAHITAHNMLVLGQFGDSASVEKEVSIDIPLVKEGDNWLVELNKMPKMVVRQQNETQSPAQNQDE